MTRIFSTFRMVHMILEKSVLGFFDLDLMQNLSIIYQSLNIDVNNQYAVQFIQLFKWTSIITWLSKEKHFSRQPLQI